MYRVDSDMQPFGNALNVFASKFICLNLSKHSDCRIDKGYEAISD